VIVWVGSEIRMNVSHGNSRTNPDPQRDRGAPLIPIRDSTHFFSGTLKRGRVNGGMFILAVMLLTNSRTKGQTLSGRLVF